MNRLNPETMPKLGMGMMRLPMKEDQIDIEQVKKMVDYYMEHGLNYFDTAYVYHGGKSECAIREALVERYPRESYLLADKLPAWSMKNAEDCDRIFHEQLERLGVEYIDNYLLHSVEDGKNFDTYQAYDCFNWAKEKKKEGKIRHFGFSYHGTPELLEEILDEHPEVEFVQIQLNYADWNNPIVQSGRLYEILAERNIPMIVMEPVKGGTLASLEKPMADKYLALQPEKSIASWAIRFVASLPAVMTLLSGMSNEEQVHDNVETIVNFTPLSEKEKQTVEEVVNMMLDVELVGCTACSYCTEGCPMQIQIPEIFKALNAIRLYPDSPMRPKNVYKKAVLNRGKASDCIGCGQCEGVCPQHLSITETLREAAEKLEA